ncbi:MAG: ribosome-associated translation inhibitor RaiA [Peptoniphilaceae bacterium]|uniref:ribosome hibernation-promoting factor, HPF/YfiA family n=1 Tax=Parvimonas sp. TaxID=1944660 RepID=UPI0025D36C97|nr:ribosome-associated translation inhibitor RaiA [Parvimonas sp.]MCI5997426.1 ribosome-associated translation inhibitor RaiA [Parvimonas sp.]MDD7764459.1 ribosome-associated translation inhibitor RaiA [Peptoniphilaceae bacterium]MDY3051140.1 ribosome-associated translation inhibitor RaiA [Parvimonas sp.]
MKLKFTGKNIEVTDALKEVTLKKFEKLNKFFSEDIEGKVSYSVIKNDRIFEATIYLPNSTILRAEESTPDMYTSIDCVLDSLERQIRKNKTKLQRKYQALETIRFEKIADNVEDEEPAKIVKVKNFDVAMMSEEEAILQMELLNHNFFVFKDAKDAKVNILYKRKDGHYGLIVVD